MNQMRAALRAGQHLGQALMQRFRVGLGQRQLGLADQARERRAQLMGGVIQEAFLLAEAATNGGQQLVHRTGQRVNLLWCLAHFNR